MRRFTNPICSLVFATMGVMVLAASARAAATNTSAGSRGGATTNAPAAEATIPQSLFVIPKQPPADGRDPFFPKSERLRRSAVMTTTNAAPAIPTADLKLNGLSGTPERPLAIINGFTFGKGDEKTLTISGVRVLVLCVEVRLRDEVAVVEVGGVRKELRLRSK